VTTVLWKILHLGSEYLSTEQRFNMKEVKDRLLDESKREKFVDSELQSFRKAVLEQWRLDKSKFKLPKVKS
jgi:hypothetical protein